MCKVHAVHSQLILIKRVFLTTTSIPFFFHFALGSPEYFLREELNATPFYLPIAYVLSPRENLSTKEFRFFSTLLRTLYTYGVIKNIIEKLSKARQNY